MSTWEAIRYPNKRSKLQVTDKCNRLEVITKFNFLFAFKTHRLSTYLSILPRAYRKLQKRATRYGFFALRHTSILIS